ncbi:MAG: histidine kinase dimerization/phospho-acceptor domain-containing protein [Thermoplasmatota archaeon]
MPRKDPTPAYFLVWGAIALVGVAADGVLVEVLRTADASSSTRRAAELAAVALAAAIPLGMLLAIRFSRISGLSLFAAGLGLGVEESLLLLLLPAWTVGWWLAHLAGVAGVLLVWAAFVAHERAERAAESRLERTYEGKRRVLVNSAAHELSTPLTSVKIQLHLLARARENGDANAARHSIEVIERNVARLDEVSRDLLAAIRAEDAMEPERPERTSSLPARGVEPMKPS